MKAYEAQFLHTFDNLPVTKRLSLMSAMHPFTHGNMMSMLPRNDMMPQNGCPMNADILSNKAQTESNVTLLQDKAQFQEISNALHGVHASSIAELRMKAKSYGFPSSDNK